MTDLQILKRCRPLFPSHPGMRLILLLFGFVMTAAGLFTPLLVRALFDSAYPYRDPWLLHTTVIALVGVSVLFFLLSSCADSLRLMLSQEALASLTQRTYDAIQCLPLSFHREKAPRDLLVRVTDDVARAVWLSGRLAPAVLTDGSRLIALLAVAAVIDARFALLLAAAVPASLIEKRLFSDRRARAHRESEASRDDVARRADERLDGIRTVRALGQERNESLSFGILLQRRLRAALRGQSLEIARRFARSFTLQMWSVALLWYVSVQLLEGRLTAGWVVALALYGAQLGGPLRSLSAIASGWSAGLASMRRLAEVFDAPPEEAEGSTASPLSFTAAPDGEHLHRVNVQIAPQRLTAIVGADGGARDVLVNYLLRAVPAAGGTIVIDGAGVSEARTATLGNRGGIIEQEAMLFDGTVMDNLLYGNEGLERGDAMRAARLSGAHDFIERLPGGYDAPVGRGGELLSLGQRLQIILARTLLRNPSVIVVDEAASEIDAESELGLQRAIAALKPSKAVIVIARRLSTLKAADAILVFEGACCVEEGTFDELLERRGAFFRFYWRAFGGFAPFRRQLELELERAARYGSRFCLAALCIAAARGIEAREGALAAERFLEGVDLLLKKRMRIGDNSVVLGGGTILVLLPEIDERQLLQFFRRMQRALPEGSAELPSPIAEGDLSFVGASITRKHFRTPEELLSALVARSGAGRPPGGTAVVTEDELLASIGGAR